MLATHVVCKQCGARWVTEKAASPNRCINRECEAGWLDLPQFVEEADADRAAEAFERERVAAMRAP